MQRYYINGELVKKRVKFLGLTMLKLEQICNVSKVQFYKYINRKNKMSLKQINNLAKKLEIDSNKLIN